ncbi:hypothetical protein [Roseinatronobacter sp. NSM]|uniref:hypothetical protein n=1 Tax=Roseinatronobacter sp. NSM TaxID=3457785 RepID=UPI0040368E79
MHIAEPVHDGKGAAIATGKNIAPLFQRVPKGDRAVRLAPSGGDFFAPLLRRDAGFLPPGFRRTTSCK